jgi:hypothetical protein
MSIPLLFGDNRKKGGMGSGMPITEMANETVGEAKVNAMADFRAAMDARDNQAAASALSRFVSLCVPVPVKEDYGDDASNSARGY